MSALAITYNDTSVLENHHVPPCRAKPPAPTAAATSAWRARTRTVAAAVVQAATTYRILAASDSNILHDLDLELR